MLEHAKNLEFEEAAALRDEVLARRSSCSLAVGPGRGVPLTAENSALLRRGLAYTSPPAS